MLALSPASSRGFRSSALQISRLLGQAVLVGLGGVPVTALADPRSPPVCVVALNLLPAALALLAAVLVRRSGGVSAARSPVRSS